MDIPKIYCNNSGTIEISRKHTITQTTNKGIWQLSSLIK